MLDDRSGQALTAPPLADLADLLDQIGDAKRIRVAGRPGSLAEHNFRSAWAQIVAGGDVERIARRKTAAALAAVRLGGVDVATLRRIGLRSGEVLTILREAVAAVAGPLSDGQRAWIDDGLGSLVAEQPVVGDVPAFVEALCDQPRAGSTRPGARRLVLEPPESHGDHCWGVAVGGALLAETFAADPAEVFLVGLAHHLHNAVLPDPGLAGYLLLGEDLPAVVARCAGEALAQLEQPLRDDLEHTLLVTRDADSPTGRAFHAADVLDRALQMRHHARAAAFAVDAGGGDPTMQGPATPFREAVLTSARLA